MPTPRNNTPPAPGDRIGILLCNLGTPDAPTPAAVKRYLAQFLSDRRIVDMPPLLWQPILRTLVLPRRKTASARKYEKIWTPEGSPLLVHTRRQALMLKGWLGEAGMRHVEVEAGMRYGSPSIAAQLGQWQQQGVGHILIVPLYPQYSATTTASVEDAVRAWAKSARKSARKSTGKSTGRPPALRVLPPYAGDAGYLHALERSVRQHWMANGQAQHLVMSFHGIPRRNVQRGDPYQQQCLQTARALAERLGLAPAQYSTTFQSRFGRLPWIEPYTQPTLERLAAQGVQTVDVICPGFASDCIETLEEIDMEVRQSFLERGGREFRYIPCLNERPEWISALRDLVLPQLRDWRTPQRATGGGVTSAYSSIYSRPTTRPVARSKPHTSQSGHLPL